MSVEVFDVDARGVGAGALEEVGVGRGEFREECLHAREHCAEICGDD